MKHTRDTVSDGRRHVRERRRASIVRPLAATLLLAACVLAGCKLGGDKPAPRTGSRATPSAAASSVATGVQTRAASAVIVEPTATATAVAAAPPPSAPTAPPETCFHTAQDRAALALAPFEDFPADLVARLQATLQARYGISVDVLPAIKLEQEDIDAARRQVVGERLIDAIAAGVTNRKEGEPVVAVTQYDMMLDGMPQWAFAFSERDNDRRLAVVSTARMDPRSFGLPPDDQALFERMLKMVSKNIGAMVLGLAPSSDPHSVMYGNILQLSDLDAMGDDLCAA